MEMNGAEADLEMAQRWIKRVEHSVRHATYGGGNTAVFVQTDQVAAGAVHLLAAGVANATQEALR